MKTNRSIQVTIIIFIALLATGSVSHAALPANSQVAKLTASDAENDDRFGASVSTSGDIVVAGAYNEDGVGGDDRGAAYVFERAYDGTDNWSQVTKLTASDAADNDRFGVSVAISGDTAVIGAHREDGVGGDDRGAAYIYERNQDGADNWGQVIKLTASDTSNDDHFGISVAISGDTVVVGAYGVSSYRGAVYVYERDQGGVDNWGEVKKLTVSSATNSEYFGMSVAISGDTIIAGADGTGTNRGVAYIFERNQGGVNNWGQVAKLTASDAEDFDRFGVSVSVSGDTAVVGARLEDGTGSDRGAAYIFERNQGGVDNWGQVTKLIASDPQNDDYFGISVSIDGDTVVIGAWAKDGTGSDQGAAYIFERNQGGTDNWGEVEKQTAIDPQNDDYFGISVAIEGNIAVIGAYGVDGTGSDRGSAYVVTVIEYAIYLPLVLKNQQVE